MTSLNPVYRIGEQIVEAIRAHEKVDKRQREAPGGRAAEAGRDPESRVARRRLPAPVLGRHAAARDDRDGALLQPGRADRRRADDGARRDDPGADHRADQPPEGRLQLGGDHDHARPRGRRRHRRRDPRDVRRPRRRAGGEARSLLRPAAPVHLGAARLDSAARPAEARPAALDQGLAAVGDQRAARAASSGRAARTHSRSASRSRRSRTASRSRGISTAAGSTSRSSARCATRRSAAATQEAA